MIIPFAPGGAKRLRGLLRLAGRQLPGRGHGRHGPRHALRVLLDNDTKLLFARPTTATGTPTSTTSRRRSRTRWTSCSAIAKGGPGIRSPVVEGLDRQAPDHGRGLVRRQSEPDRRRRPDGSKRSARPSMNCSTRLDSRSGQSFARGPGRNRPGPMKGCRHVVRQGIRRRESFGARADARLARDPGDRAAAEAGAVLRHSRALARRRCSSGPSVPPPADTSYRFRRELVERGQCLAGGRNQLCGP